MCKNKDQKPGNKIAKSSCYQQLPCSPVIHIKDWKRELSRARPGEVILYDCSSPFFSVKSVNMCVCVCVHACLGVCACMCAYCNYKQLQKNAIPQLLAPITWFPSKVTWFSYNWSTVHPGSSLWKYSLYWQQCWLFVFQLFVQLFLTGWNMVKECRKSLENWENSAT